MTDPLENPLQRMERLLDELYGAQTGQQLLPEVRALLERHRAKLPAPRRAGLSQRDALLITYADQLTQAGRLPLDTLADFAATWLKDIVSGLHILPFYPATSDDGFSVSDYYRVDPALGGWEQIDRLRADFRLMFDAVFNHASAQGAWFQGYLRGEPEYRDFFIAVEGDPDLSRVARPRTLPLLTTFTAADGERRIWTTFSADQVDLNFANPRVLLRMLDVLLFYVEHGANLIRLDAIGY
ncbi:hypothetical protein FDZ74_05610, partial [bacterium]